MPGADPSDRRERAPAACEAGEGRQSEIARAYRIGERTLSGWLKLAREEGRRSPKPRRGGRAPLGGEQEALAGLVAERNDATLAEYADLLAERTGVRRSASALCRALRALDLAGLAHRYLPSYSPDLNPIERAWSKLKTRLRAVGARSKEALEQALGPALATITAQDARGWFRLAGYPSAE